MNNPEESTPTSPSQKPPPEDVQEITEKTRSGDDGTEPYSFTPFMSLQDSTTASDALFFMTPSNRSSHWSIAWSDLMMTMFILFLVMFMYKSAHKEFLNGTGLGTASGTTTATEMADPNVAGANNYFQYADRTVAKVYDLSRQLIGQKEFKEFAAIGLEADRTLRIVLTGDLLFDLGSSKIKDEAHKNLLQIANLLQYTPYMINVIGHTDSIPITGSETDNWELSALRASSVARFLIKETNLPPSHFYITGHAQYQPVADNDSSENRAKNRRVEIVLTKLLPLQENTFSPEIKQQFGTNSIPPPFSTTHPLPGREGGL